MKRLLLLAVLTSCTAALADDGDGPLFTITHLNGIREDVRITSVYPGGAPELWVRRNKSTVALKPGEIVRLKRVSRDENRFELTLAGGEAEVITIVGIARLLGRSSIAGHEADYNAALNAIDVIERKADAADGV